MHREKTQKDGKIKDEIVKKERQKIQKIRQHHKKIMAMRKEDICFEKNSEKIQPTKRGPGAHSKKKMNSRSNSEKRTEVTT